MLATLGLAILTLPAAARLPQPAGDARLAPARPPDLAPVQGTPTPAPPCGWNLAPSPIVGASNRLQSVAVLSSVEAWAAGYYLGSGTRQTLIENWSGSQWSITTSPNVGSGNNMLNGVAVAAANDAWAVGYSTSGSVNQTLVLRWNGTQWGVVSSPNVGAGNNVLNSVAIVAPNNAWAVGYYLNGTARQTLVLHWDGLTWAVVASVDPSASYNEFLSVAGTAANDLWAVGDAFSGGYVTLIEHWDGTQWSTITSPHPGAASNVLTGVATLAANDAWAVGTTLNGPLYQTLALHWDGTTWTVQPTPNSAGNSYFQGLTAPAANDIWAVGYATVAGADQTLTAHWDGAGWGIVASPNATADGSHLQSVAAAGPTNVWAVGYARTSGVDQALIAHYVGVCASPTPTVTGTPPTATPTPTITLTPTATETPCSVVQVLNEGFESGTLGPFSTNGPPSWRTSASIAHTGIYAAYGQDWAYISDQRLTLRNPLAIPTTVSQATLSFWQRYTLETRGGAGADGGVLELSTGGGTNWNDGGAYITLGGYGGAILCCRGNPLASRPAWVGDTGPNFVRVTVDLTAFRGQQVLFRFREGTDMSGGATGWRVDDITVIFAQARCDTPTPTITGTPPTATATITPTGSRTPTRSPTSIGTPRPTGTPVPASPTATATMCPVQFSDVPPSNPFYTFVRCLACRGIVSGYADGTFRWGNNVTRSQLAKILASAAGSGDPIPTAQQTFADVPPSQPFWIWIEQLAGRGAISGYACGGPGEPCDGQQRPYFRPNLDATRGQIAKIAATTAEIADPIPTAQQTFSDVPPSQPFWLWIERLVGRGIISGYTCGGPREPCDPQNRPYFRPGASTTRGQLAKIAGNTFFPDCQTPARR